MGILSDVILKMMDAGGLYHPVFNSETYRSDVPDDGWVNGRNVKAHEREHKRQYNHPGDYTSPIAVTVANSVGSANELRGMGYSDTEVPFELMAFMAGANASDNNPDTQAQAPHPGWTGLNDEQKLFITKNQQAHLTDQDYLQNLSRFGLPVASGIERAKHLGGGLAETFRRAIGKIR